MNKEELEVKEAGLQSKDPQLRERDAQLRLKGLEIANLKRAIINSRAARVEGAKS